jgi:squalene-hopene/tetraprenyl-beta-curcumene cyclase
MRTLLLFSVFFLFTCNTILCANEHNEKVKAALQKGLAYLRSQKHEKEYWGPLAFTALVAKAYQELLPHGLVTLEEIQPILEYIASQSKPDGGIYSEPQNTNYVTSVCLMALATSKNSAYDSVIQKAQKYLIAGQYNETQGVSPKDKYYGGFGYGGEKRNWCDMSNTQLTLEALAESGVPGDHEVFQKALVFLSRSQNNSESNDQTWASDDPKEYGGFVYMPGNSKAGETKLPNGQLLQHSYGSMTYAGLKSMIYAKVDRKDTRIQSALEWLTEHYSVDQNPGMGLQGLYYYYHTFAKSLNVYNTEFLTSKSGKKYLWRRDLGNKLIALQKENGSWINEEPRWFENNPVLVTCYSLIALEFCILKAESE